MYKWSLRITMSNLYKINGNLLALKGKLFKFPTILINPKVIKTEADGKITNIKIK